MMRSMFTILLAAVAMTACSEETPLPLESDVRADLAHLGGAAAPQTFEVQVTNLTTGQPMTPPLAVTHRPALRLFQVGRDASKGIQEIAENGNLAPMLAAVGSSRHVHDVVVAAGDPVPPLLPGEERSFTIQATAGTRWLSFAAMLICTNDGFTGIDRLRLPRTVGASVTVETNGYDAGTELNTEDFDDLVPPCGPLTGVDSGGAGTGSSNPTLVEGGRIHHHDGIQGSGDLLVEVHGWTDPVTRVRVTRIQ